VGDRKKLFISYRRTDKDFATSLYTALSSDFDVFFDTEGGVKYAEEFPLALKEGVESSDILLMVIGDSYCQEFKERYGKNDFVIEEIKIAKESNRTIIPILMDSVDMPSCFPKELAFVSNLNAFLFGRGSFSMYINELKEVISKETPNVDDFTQSVIDAIEKERMVVLFSQDFTDIEAYYQRIREEFKSRFKSHCFEISVPSFVEDEREYFACIAQECAFDCEVKKVSEWNNSMRKRLKNSSEPLLLFISDLENGNEALNKQFATMLRNLKNEFLHFHLILIGRKALARLVYGEGMLSPLNSAKELFFPENQKKLGEERIAQQFATLGRYQEQLCKLLAKDSLGRYATWSYNELINKLFWKNLLLKKGKHFVWRGELSKEIGREVLGCDG